MNELYRRVELVLLHEEGAEPSKTAPWLEARPNLARHHHIRLTHPKVSDRTCVVPHLDHAAALKSCRPDACWCVGLLLVMCSQNLVDDLALVSVYWQMQGAHCVVVKACEACCQ